MTSGYFDAQTTTPSIDPDTLEEHDLDDQPGGLDAEHLGVQRDYFHRITREAHRCFAIAKQARRRGFDPELEPEIPFAEDLASRVEALVGPEDVADRIRELADEHDRENLALTISKEIAEGRFGEHEGAESALDQAIRTGLAILTEGILVAPLEGVAEVKVRENNDGTRYADVYFAGPIRAAGGTGQALSVLIADVVRRELGLDAWQATEAEIERIKEEIPAYKRAQNLQYTPPPEEIEAIIANLPVGVNGEGTESEEVSGYRDLPRVETNQLRGGACLVVAEGLTLKAPKLLKHVDSLGLEGWGFLDQLLGGDEDGEEDEEDKPEIQPVKTFIKELTAGRPVFSHPMATGGFRLRYGRVRNAGLAATAVHPALTVLVDDFLAVGTQLKVERPGKGTIVTPCDEVEPPIVRCRDGRVVEVGTVEQARELVGRVDEILDLGEMLVPYGEFLENNKPMPQSAWCTEWWAQILEDRGEPVPQIRDAQPALAFAIAEDTDTPLHPRFTLLWHDVDPEAIAHLAEAMEQARLQAGRLALPNEEQTKRVLEAVGATHEVTEDDEILLDPRCSMPVVRAAGYRIEEDAIVQATEPPAEIEDPLALAEHLSGVRLEPKAPCRIGARMGRPEKAAEREMSPLVHGLFPIGNAGGLQRKIGDAAQKGTIGSTGDGAFAAIEAGQRECKSCELETLKLDCPECEGRTRPTGEYPTPSEIELGDLVEEGLERLELNKLPDPVKGVKGLTSEDKIPEPVEKAILRAKHDVSVFKDGTCRHDMTDIPLTAFRPAEINTSVERLRELGYTEDVQGEALREDDQLVPMRVQDVIVNEGALAYMARVADFVDDLLTRLYGIEPYYDLDEPSDLVGHLAVGLAPHTSGGVLCRIIGTTKAAGHFGHPYFHAAKRRNCVSGDSDTFVMDGDGPERVQLSDLYEEIDGREEEVDDLGTRAKDVGDVRVFAADPDTGRIEPRTINRVYRAPAPDHLLRIETETGRTLTCTPEHRLQILADDRIKKKRARELDEDDRLLFAKELPLQKSSADAIDLMVAMQESNIPGVMVRGLGEELDDLIERCGGLKAAAQAAGLSMKGLDNYRRRDSIPLSCLTDLTDQVGDDPSTLPEELRFGMRRDNVEVPRILPMSPAMMRLAGYYLAEGHARCDPGKYYQVNIAATEEPMIEDIRTCIRVVFDKEVEHDGKALVASGRLIHHLFTEILGLGKNAHEKRIPAKVAGLPFDLTSEMLAAYFAGDGSVERGRLHVTCHSASRQLLRDIGLQLGMRGIAYRLQEDTREAGGAARDFYEAKDDEIPSFTSHRLSVRSDQAVRFLDEIGIGLKRKEEDLEAVRDKVRSNRFGPSKGDLLSDGIKDVECLVSQEEWVYDLEVEGHHNYLLNDFVLTSNCDGDEDCLMLLMDGLLNFSRSYLPRNRGGQMDAPLTLSIRVDPEEIDGEAHNIETVETYPLAFFEATREHPDPKEVEHLVEIVEDRLASDAQYDHLTATHDTASFDEGPRLSAYKTIDTMSEKMDGQLSLAERLRAVDAGDVASRVICDHFMPDIIGNLKAFSRQTVRCAKCNSKYRRVPLSGRCRKCKNKLTMTVHEASVKKYVDVAREVARNYDVDAYTQQRLKLVEESIESLFENDKVEKAQLTDFM